MNKISGILIFLSFISSLILYFINEEYLIYSGICLFFSFIILFPTLKNKRMISLLLFICFILFLISYFCKFDIKYDKLFSINQYLISLLIGITFLKLVSKPKLENIKNPPRGEKSFIKTYISLHFFSSIINISASLLLADKLFKHKKASKSQIILLTRAFSSAAYWSPFFVAFAIVLTYLPNISIKIVMFSGLILALCSSLITYFEMKINYNLDEFEGYDINLRTSYIPILLAFFILLSTYLNENLKILVLIPLYAFILTCLILFIKNGIKHSLFILKNFILEDLSLMKLEISLFILAGIFSVLVTSIISSINFSYDFTYLNYFTWDKAALILLVFIILAFIGIHPIITISIIAPILENINHTLFAMVFLMAWSITVCASPFSGANLTLYSRYNINPKEIFSLNILHIILMYGLCISILYIFSNSFLLSA
ncbi:MAG: tellurium resistance protein TerC [Campylobacterales bacterium]|nr:tellurium resistance protein TerC [Campylobacterales bacterium]